VIATPSRATTRLLLLLAAAATAVPARVAAQELAPERADWTEDDWRLYEEKVRWAEARRLDTLDAGAAAARLGETFLGTPYRPGTLEGPAPERLVVNLRELDCVTFVENVLALLRFARADGVAALADSAAARRRFESYLRALRYRDGTVAGYGSRLHYFSEWMSQAERAGWISPVALPGAEDDAAPIDFMSRHAQLYPALADSGAAATVASAEARLSAGPPRRVVPKEAVAAAAPLLRDGDVVAVAATTAGLDVVHTGFALWRDGALHLMHAPLVGRSVEVSALPLADRLLGIATQRGITVARPLPAPGPSRSDAVPPSW
jgi:hypothetical protein